MLTVNLHKDEKDNLLLVLPNAHKQAIEEDRTIYIMLDLNTRSKCRVGYGRTPQAGYLMLAIVNPKIVWIFWKLVDPVYPVYTEYVDKIQHAVPCEVW